MDFSLRKNNKQKSFREFPRGILVWEKNKLKFLKEIPYRYFSLRKKRTKISMGNLVCFSQTKIPIGNLKSLEGIPNKDFSRKKQTKVPTGKFPVGISLLLALTLEVV